MSATVAAASLKSELRHIAQQGSTVLTGQLAVMLFALIDSVLAGRFSADALAAMSVATAVNASVFVALMGVTMAALPMYAERFGAGKPLEVGKLWRQTLLLVLGLSALGMPLLWLAQPALALAKVPAALQTEVMAYLRIQALCVPLALFFRAFGSLAQAVAQARWVMWLQLASLPLKALVSAWLVFGGWGVPAQGALGCALGTLFAYAVMATAAAVLLRRLPAFQPIGAQVRLDKPDLPQLKLLLRLGLPSGGAMLFEVTSFTLMAVLIARLGSAASGAHQVAVSVAALMFMVPLSMSIASSARVSFWLGAKDVAFSNRVAWLCVKLTCAWGIAGPCLLALLAPSIAAAFSTDAVLVATATGLLYWVCVYQFFDSMQTIFVFLLRCHHVAVAPFVVYALVLWGLGLGGGYWLAFVGNASWPAWQTPAAFWAAGTVALALTALAFWWLFVRALAAAAAGSTPRGAQATPA